MKIYIANDSQQKYGGGFSFIENFRKAMPEAFTDNYEEADIFFVAGASMIKPEAAQKAKVDGKKVVLRIDNVLKHTRNGGKGMARMKNISHIADLVIYQSNWAHRLLAPFTNKTGPVILNGVDLNRFKPGQKHQDKTVFLYSRFNRDESKNWNVAQYNFIIESQGDPNAEIWIVGQYSSELIGYNFDFYDNEKYRFFGVQSPDQLADLYRQAQYFLYTYFNDACSNSLIEALVSGCEIPTYCNYYLSTGGAPEITSKFRQEGRDYFGIDRMIRDYWQELNEL